MTRLRTKLLIVAFFLSSAFLWPEPMKSIEFRNQDIKDVLLALGELNGISIVPDETVEGKASYVFSNMEFEQALTVFLDSFHLSFSKVSGVYYVSKVAFSVGSNGRYSVSATDVPLRFLLRSLSQQAKKTILFDALPNDPFSLVVQDATLEEILAIVTAKYSDFTVEKQEKYLYLKNKQAVPANGRSPAVGGITKTETGYSMKVERGRFRDLLLSLFSLENREFVILLDRDVDIQNLYLKDKTFEEALRALLLHGNADYSLTGGVYYILEVQRKDLLKKFQTTVILTFDSISSSDFTKLLPANLNSANLFRLDEKGNKIVLSGLMEEIKPLWDFIVLIDKPNKNGLPTKVDLEYLKTDEFLPLLPAEFATFNPQPLPGKTGFLITVPDARRAALLDFVRMIDRPATGYPLRLRFLKSDELLAKLPPSAGESNLSKTSDPSLVFFKGTLAQRKALLRDLEEIDVPRSQIRYEILVLQFQDGVGLNATSDLTVAKSTSTDTNAFSGDFGKLLTLDFDVLSNFGLTFGLSLSAGMSNTKTKVVADTTLNGLSGEKLTFQNTNTTRYKDTETTTTSGTTTTASVVRELTSGLLVSLEGWISSDNMITLKIDSTLSKQVTSSSDSDALPSTSEKKLSTLVRTPSGKPIIISGLKQEDTSFSLEKIPVLGDIPLVGLLFQKRVESVEKTEFAIYLVPILERPDRQDVPEDRRILGYYKRLTAKS